MVSIRITILRIAACSVLSRVVKPAWIFGANTRNGPLSARMSDMTSSNPRSCSSHIRMELLISISWARPVLASGSFSSS